MPAAPSSAPLIVGLLILGGIVALAVYLVRQNRKRVLALEAQATALGLQFTRAGGELAVPDYRTLGALRPGLNPSWENTIHGTYQGLPVHCFDFVYYTESTDSKGNTQRTRHECGVALALVNASWPALTAVPETFGKKLWDALGGDDIDFESDEFSRRFWVKCDDRKFAYDAIQPRTMDLMLGFPWQHWEIRGNKVCTWHGRVLKPDQVPIILDGLVRFIECLPSFLRPAALPVSAATAPPGGSAARPPAVTVAGQAVRGGRQR